MKSKCWLLLAAGLFCAPVLYGACIYSVTPSGRTHGHGATNNLIVVNAETNCAWTVENDSSWITLLSGGNGGTGTGVVNYAVSQNTNVVGRTGIVTIASQTFIVRQESAPCNFSLTPATRTHGPGAANNSIDMGAVAGCGWGVVNTSVWITFPGATSGVGNGTVPYSVAANTTPLYRTGHVVIADQVFALIQRSAPCLYELSPTNRSHGYAGSTGLVTVSTGPSCTWSVDNTNTWITIITNASGIGVGTFVYNVGPNPDNFPRSGTFSVFDQSFTVFQQLAPCSVSIAPTSESISADAETNVVVVSSPGNCAWGVTNNNSWITVFPLSGTGNGTVTWSVPDNVSSVGRTGVVQISGNNFTVRQAGLNCNFRLSPTNRMHGYAATTNSVNLDTLNLCSWDVVNANSWVTILSAGNGLGDSTIVYALAANGDLADRSGVVQIGGQPFYLTQRGISCALTVSPLDRAHGHGFASNSISVMTTPGCAWGVINTNSWISIITPLNGTGTGVVNYTVAPNPTPFPRSGFVSIEEATILISQAGVPCTYSVTPATRTHGYGAVTNSSFNLITTNGCPWGIVNTNTWIAITDGDGGTNSATVTYTVDANPNPIERIGVVTVDGQTFTITQRATVCFFSLSPGMRNHGHGSTTGTVGIATASGCSWPVVNTNEWISILSYTNGLGTGAVSYAVSSNLNVSPRMGMVYIGDQTFVVTQAAFLCSYKLSPTNRTHGFGATTNSVTVTAGLACAWSASSLTDWITIVSGASGTGNGGFTYSIAPNYGTTTRIGHVVLADEVLTLTQLPSIDGFAFEAIAVGAGGTVTLKLEGGPPGIWEMQGSSDLVTWSRLGDITNTTGRVEYTIPSGGNKRFYRAIIP